MPEKTLFGVSLFDALCMLNFVNVDAFMIPPL